MNGSFRIWQQPNWPHFSWQAEALAPLLRACGQAQGRLLGMLGAVGRDTEVQSSLDAMLQNIVTSSAIEVSSSMLARCAHLWRGVWG